MQADLIVRNGNIVTLDPARPRAQAMSVLGGRILGLGDDREVLASAGPATKVIDARGLTVLPGFNDNHLHALGMGYFFQHPNLFGLDAEQIVAALVQHYPHPRPGERILGFAWDYPFCPHPNKALLDRAFPDQPVVLRQYSGHAQWLNTVALAPLLAEERTPGSHVGRIVRDADGVPTGIVQGTVVHSSHRRDLLKRVLDPRSCWRLLAIALDRFRRAGITSVQDNAWQPFSVLMLALWQRLGLLTARFSCWSFGHFPTLARAMRFLPYDGLWLRRGPEKWIVDGAFSPHTAWLLEPYAGEPDNRGRAELAPAELERVVRRGARRGRQLAFHAIGDAAVRAVVDAVEAVAREVPAVTRLRYRIEHAQLVDPAELPRMRRLGIIASVQPTALALPERDRALFGEPRFARLYPYRDLLDAGVPLSFGSDIPGEIEYDPLQIIYRAVSRRGAPGFAGRYDRSQAVSVNEAVTALCRGSAYAEFMEAHKGTLAPGMLADFIVLSDDIFAVDVEAIPKTKVLLTAVGGRVVHSLL